MTTADPTASTARTSSEGHRGQSTPTPSAAAHQELLAEVLGRYAASPNPRLREITEAAIRHLHEFAAEVNLQRDEWFAGIQFLTQTGKVCDDVRQEFILLSDTLGVSTLVEMLTHDGAQGSTENTVLGPFYVPGSPERGFGESMLEDPDDGDRVVIRGRVTDGDGTPLAGAVLDVWQNATNGFYACQQPGAQRPTNLRGIYRTDPDGRYEIRTVRPVPYPIPDDGPAGQLLKANGRNWWRPGHTHVWVRHPGHKELITHVFDEASEFLQSDAVFGVRPSLSRPFVEVDGELSATFDIVLDRTD
jgi:protocatechuate 3,4-dioxygenase beta subunit